MKETFRGLFLLNNMFMCLFNRLVVVEFTLKDFVCPCVQCFSIHILSLGQVFLVVISGVCLEKIYLSHIEGLITYYVSWLGVLFHCMVGSSIFITRSQFLPTKIRYLPNIGVRIQFSSPCNGNAVFPIFLPFLPIEKSFSK